MQLTLQQESAGQDTVGNIIMHYTDWIMMAALKTTMNHARQLLDTVSERSYLIWSSKLVCFTFDSVRL